MLQTVDIDHDTPIASLITGSFLVYRDCSYLLLQTLEDPKLQKSILHIIQASMGMRENFAEMSSSSDVAQRFGHIK
jgi:hypothetical protein